MLELMSVVQSLMRWGLRYSTLNVAFESPMAQNHRESMELEYVCFTQNMSLLERGLYLVYSYRQGSRGRDTCQGGHLEACL